MKNIDRPEETSNSAMSTKGNQSSGTQHRLATILIVENEPALRDILQLILGEPMNSRVFAFETSEQALEFATNIDFDVVMSDLIRPGMDGFDFLKAYKADHPLTPVIILSGNGTGECKRRAIELGAFRCLRKPQLPATIISAVNEALEYRASLKGHTDDCRFVRLRDNWWVEPGIGRYSL